MRRALRFRVLFALVAALFFTGLFVACEENLGDSSDEVSMGSASKSSAMQSFKNKTEKKAAAENKDEVLPPLPEIKFHFGAPPHLSLERSKKEHKPLADFVGRVIDREVDIVIPVDYENLITSTANGDIDFSLLTPLAYVLAKDKEPKIIPLVTVVGEGATHYRAYIVVRTDDDVVDLAKLDGDKIAFVDKGSTSGYLLPRLMLQQAGYDLKKNSDNISFSGSHPHVVEDILSGKVRAGAVASTTFKNLSDQNLENELRIVAKSEWIPFGVVAVHPSFPAPWRDKLKKSLLNLSIRSPEGRRVLTGLATISGFIEPDDSVYDKIRKMAREVGLLEKNP